MLGNASHAVTPLWIYLFAFAIPGFAGKLTTIYMCAYLILVRFIAGQRLLLRESQRCKIGEDVVFV